jgi:hypothetical protein
MELASIVEFGFFIFKAELCRTRFANPVGVTNKQKSRSISG